MAQIPEHFFSIFAEPCICCALVRPGEPVNMQKKIMCEICEAFVGPVQATFAAVGPNTRAKYSALSSEYQHLMSKNKKVDAQSKKNEAYTLLLNDVAPLAFQIGCANRDKEKAERALQQTYAQRRANDEALRAQALKNQAIAMQGA